MKHYATPPPVDARGWLIGRFKVGDHVRIPTADLCGSVASVLRFPRVTGYGIMLDDCRPHPGMTSGSFSESELEMVR